MKKSIKIISILGLSMFLFMLLTLSISSFSQVDGPKAKIAVTKGAEVLIHSIPKNKSKSFDEYQIIVCDGEVCKQYKVGERAKFNTETNKLEIQILKNGKAVKLLSLKPRFRKRGSWKWYQIKDKKREITIKVTCQVK